MPRSFSSSPESMTSSSTCWPTRKVPHCFRRASTSVVLPWSTCATIAIARRSARVVGGASMSKASIANGGAYNDCRQGGHIKRRRNEEDAMLSVCLSLALVRAAPPPAAGGFTLEQVLSAPFPTHLTAAPAGGGVAWIFDSKGVRNVWAALPPEYKGRAVTTYPADDGQEISDLAFTPDGKSIAYVRGGDPNRMGEIPNPMSDPAGATQAVYVVSAAGGEPKKLGDGSSPAVSPKGDRVAFTQKGKVFVAPLDGAEKPSPAFEARGRSSELAWSPDGRLLAFVSGRGGHSFVGVFDPEKKAIRWLSPSVDLDDEPVWSPDGKRVAFVRIPGSPAARQILRPHREGPPWSILVADPATGEAKTVF